MAKTNDRGSAHDTPETEPPIERKSKGGRPRRDADGDSLEKLTIRLTPKLKFGLELLSRAQHRSLSQAIEWALQVGINNYPIGSLKDKKSLGSVVDEAWKAESEAGKLIYLYQQAPGVLSFEDFKTCEFIVTSDEFREVGDSLPANNQSIDAAPIEVVAAHQKKARIFGQFVNKFWPVLRRTAIGLADEGKATFGLSMLAKMGRPFSTKPPIHSLSQHMELMNSIGISDNPERDVLDWDEERFGKIRERQRARDELIKKISES